MKQTREIQGVDGVGGTTSGHGEGISEEGREERVFVEVCSHKI